MNDAWSFVLSCISDSWNWLTSWQFHGVSFGFYIIGFIILSILIDRIIG